MIPFFAFDPAIRKIIYTTNAIESLNRVIRNFEKGGRNVREWFAARNHFTIMFEERFNA